MQIVVDQDIPLAENVRLIKRLYKVPATEIFSGGLKFAYQYLLRIEEEWIELCRVDNYKHDKHRTGTHVHKHGQERVEFMEMDFTESEAYIKALGQRLKAIRGELQW